MEDARIADAEALKQAGAWEDRHAYVEQYSLGKIIAVWAAAAIPMGVLAWVAAPLLEDQLGGDEPLVKSLLLCITAGLIWQFILVLILLRQELGTLEWSRVRPALWLLPPRNPKSGRVGGRVWLWVLLLILLIGAWESIPGISGPSPRDLADFLDSTAGEDFFRDAWGWFAIVVVFAVFNTVLGEELLFRGILLPRMQGVFGRWDWLANGVLFALYHLHVPWVIPKSLIGDTLLLAYPSRRFGSSWVGILVHSAQSIVVIGIVLALVLD
jgi:uncharacterized protein